MYARIIKQDLKPDDNKKLIVDPEKNKNVSRELNLEIDVIRNKVQALKSYNTAGERRNKVQHGFVCMLQEATVKGAQLIKQVKHKKKE